ncbi:unnamed protein product [Linum trigynum]|uniref:Uncharacterized protein n=1 Tax=Linum trigynum TaxID=586398 RepID=A0AAV2EPC3_9ROSI
MLTRWLMSESRVCSVSTRKKGCPKARSVIWAGSFYLKSFNLLRFLRLAGSSLPLRSEQFLLWKDSETARLVVKPFRFILPMRILQIGI